MAPSIAPARVAAFDVIRRVFEEEAYADRALEDGHRAASTIATWALARQLAYGTVQRARMLDHAIEIAGLMAGWGALDAAVRAALRLGAYQLLFLDGVPRYAACSTSRSSASAGQGSNARCRSRTPSSAASPTRGAPG